MTRRMIAIAAGMTLTASGLLADFSYQETSTITGGMMVSMMKTLGAFSKQMRQSTDPIHSTVAVQGDRMVHSSPTHTTIIDLGAQTMTSVDAQKKTYSVMTFDEYRQALEKMSERMKQNDKGEMNFKITAKDTGNTRQVAGFNTKEFLVKMEMEGTDKQSGQKGAMVITTDMWVAPSVAGYTEVRAFYQKMAEKLNWSPSGGMFMNRPDVAKGMAEVYKEIGKMDGIPVLQNVKMGAEGMAPAGEGGQQTAAQPDAPPQQQQAQQQQQQPQQAERPSVGGALGSALGGRFGLGRKKSQPKPDDQSSSQASSSQPAQASSSGTPPSGNQPAAGSLMEMTIEMNGFSSGPVDQSLFAVPAGFKKVEADMKRGIQ